MAFHIKKREEFLDSLKNIKTKAIIDGIIASGCMIHNINNITAIIIRYILVLDIILSKFILFFGIYFYHSNIHISYILLYFTAFVNFWSLFTSFYEY